MYETNINKKFKTEKLSQRLQRGILYLFAVLLFGTLFVILVSKSYDSVVAIIYIILGLIGLMMTAGSIANLIKIFKKLILEIK